MLSFSVNVDVYQIIEQSKGTLLKKPKTQVGRQWWGAAVTCAVDELSDKRKNQSRKRKQDKLASVGADKANVDAYGKASEWKSAQRQAQKEVFVIDDGSSEDNKGEGVSAAVWRYVDENIESIVERDAVRSIVQSFMDLQEEIYVEEGLSLWRLINLAKTANEQVITTMRNLAKKYENMYEIVHDLLHNPYALSRMEVEMC